MGAIIFIYTQPIYEGGLCQRAVGVACNLVRERAIVSRPVIGGNRGADGDWTLIWVERGLLVLGVDYAMKGFVLKRGMKL